jgi:DNA modification methylase
MNAIEVPTPKQPNRPTGVSWFPYHAGFSPAFVTGTLTAIAPETGAVVADPWNGAGTTTWAAAKEGYRTTGFDRNPVMVEVARGRMMPACRAIKVKSIAQSVATAALSPELDSEDPLRVWFGPLTAGAFRRAVQTAKAEPDRLIRGFLLTALMRTAGALTRKFRAANPTWVKRPIGRRVSLAADGVASRFLAKVGQQLARPAAEWLGCDDYPTQIHEADAAAIPLAACSVDLVVTSPPYCTRVDYAQSTIVELAVLGVGGPAASELRAKLTGTTSIRPILTEPGEEIGVTGQQLLAAIRSHSSKSSANYYWKTYVQYFADLAAAVRDTNRYLKPGGSAVYVVQDSWYKELHVNLARILTEIAIRFGWQLCARKDFAVRRTLCSVNTRSRRYREEDACHETVLWFKISGR